MGVRGGDSGEEGWVGNVDDDSSVSELASKLECLEDTIW